MSQVIHSEITTEFDGNKYPSAKSSLNDDNDNKNNQIRTEYCGDSVEYVYPKYKALTNLLSNDAMAIAMMPGSFNEKGHLIYVPCVRCTLLCHRGFEISSNSYLFTCGKHTYINHWVFFRCTQCPTESHPFDNDYTEQEIIIPCPIPTLLIIAESYVEHDNICCGGSECSKLFANPDDFQCCNEVAFGTTSIQTSLYANTIKTKLKTLPVVELPTKISHSCHECTTDGCIDYVLLTDTLNSLSCTLTGETWTGSFTRIFKVVDRHSRNVLCIKAACLHRYKNIICHSVDTEILLQMTNEDTVSDYILPLLGAFRLNDTIYMVSQLQENGSLWDYLNRNEDIDEFDCISMVEDICKGVSFLHSHNIAHRNLTLENILVDKNGKIKVAGMGSSCYVEPGRYMNYPFNSYIYAAPELFQTRSFDPLKPDIWTVGIISYYLFKRHHLFPDSCISRVNYWPLKEWSGTKSSRDFIEYLLIRDFFRRPGITQVLLHPWFNFSFSDLEN